MMQSNSTGQSTEAFVLALNSTQGQAEHRRQLAALERCEIRINVQTPWGLARTSEIYADGVVYHSTATRGGLHLSAEWNALVHPSWRNAEGWYEGDFEWVKVAVTFPELFTDLERRIADDLLNDGGDVHGPIDCVDRQ